MGRAGLVISVKDETTRRFIAGATVEMWTESGEFAPRTTDADGRVDATELHDGWVGARVTAPGYAPSDPQWKTVGDGIVLALHFELQPGIAVEGVVVARDGGAPVAGARVTACRADSIRSSEIPFDLTTADADGRFRFAAVPRADDWEHAAVLVVSSEGLATTDTVVVPTPRDEGSVRVRIVLPPGASVHGSVVDEHGAPLTEARVEARPGEVPAHIQSPLGFGQSWSFHADGTVFLARALTADTDGEGRFEMPGLVRGLHYTLVAGRVRGMVTAPVAIDTTADIAPVELQVRRPSRVVVRVVDPEGRPVDDARLHLGARDEATHSPGTGTWLADAIYEPNVDVFVQAPGYVHEYRRIDVTPGRTRTVRVKLKAARDIAGVVVDDTGAPVPGARVWAEDSSTVADDAGHDHAPESDAEGRFRLEGLPAKRHRVMARGPCHPQVVLRGVRPPADDVRIVAPRAATVRVRFAFGDGAQPPREIDVVHAPLPRRGGAPDASADTWRVESCDLDGGVAEIRRVPVPRAIVRLLVPGFQRIERTVKAAYGETVDLGTIALEPAIDVDGRVVDADGRPAAGVCVYVEQPWALHERRDLGIRATTADDGTFRLRGLWRGRVEIAVSVERFFPAHFARDVGDGKLMTLALPRLDPDNISDFFKRR